MWINKRSKSKDVEECSRGGEHNQSTSKQAGQAHLRAFVFSKAKTTRCATLALNNFINNNDFKCKNGWLNDFCQKSDRNDRSLEIISLQAT